ncbi:folate transporter 1-like isoform X2 [Adelges cooleyi]|uniref:folate transporter 1-like isoform X2 n=1 Tax=Adelges cooleyi TaxID=133065 RepID=UPI00217F4B7B|nr:folate transporter 1-like isoform X2 [Adelges cooleyi]
MYWKRISFCLCIYGILKEFRPSESYVIPFLQGPRMNFTEEQINNEILPIGIYSLMVSMIFVTLTTDLLRYKAVIVIQAICGTVVYAILSLCTSFPSMIIVQILYGIFSAAEVGYYTYTYSVVDTKYYQTVTSHTRAAHLMGRFISSIVAQLSISANIFDSYQLNFLTLGSLAAGLLWTTVLPSVEQKVIEPEAQKMTAMNIASLTPEEAELEIAENETLQKDTLPTNDSQISWNYFQSLCEEYKNLQVLKWSFWIVLATCGFNQVLFYIQSLWESISHESCVEKNCQTYSEWNGAVDAIYTVISFCVTILCGKIAINVDKFGNFIILLSAITQWATLYTSILWNSIYISYINFILYCTVYQGMMTIASTEIAKCVNKDKHGFVFGTNNLLAAILQSLATLFMNSLGMSSSSKALFKWYAGYCFFIGICFLIIFIKQIIRK